MADKSNNEKTFMDRINQTYGAGDHREAFRAIDNLGKRNQIPAEESTRHTSMTYWFRTARRFPDIDSSPFKNQFGISSGLIRLPGASFLQSAFSTVRGWMNRSTNTPEGPSTGSGVE